MSVFRRRYFLTSVALAVTLVAVAGAYLLNTQASAERNLRHDFATHASLTARLAAGALAADLAQNASYAKSTFSVPESSVQAAVDAAQLVAPGPQAVVLSGDGRILASYPHGLARDTRQILSRPEIVRALAGHASLSDVVVLPGGPVVMVTVSFQVAGSLRVWTSAAPLDTLTSFMTGYLGTANGVARGRALLLDSHGVLLASSGHEPAGKPLTDRALLEASHRSPSGTIEGDAYTSAPIAATPWRIVFAAPTGALLAPVAATRRIAWQLFGGIALAILCILGLAASALRSAHRLAYARLHDGLTGLPNRKVFNERTDRALADIELRGGQLAVLFIDLDHFKPVNDRHGHAIGDSLLKTVATRLTDSVRSGDLVSRFGGDEFVVLCSPLTNHAQATEVAERIQRAIATPFEVEELELHVSASIGVAYHSSDQPRIDADSLIGHADLAMYEAKRRSRGQIETTEPPTPTTAPQSPIRL